MALPAPALLAMETVVEAAAEERLVLVVGDPYDANLLTNNGFVATARLGGFAAWTTADAAALAGSPVAILAGAHERDAAHAVADALVAKRCTVRLVAPPPEAAPQFPDDTPILAWLTALAEAPEGATAAFRAQLAALVAQAPRHPGAPSRFRVLSDLELESLPPVQYLVDGVLPVGVLAGMYGAPESGKSFVAVDLACSLATGTPFMGHLILRTGRVLYVVAEGAEGMGQRVKAWKLAHGFAGQSVGVHFITEPARLMDPAEAEHVIRAARTLPDDPVLVVIDTLHRAMAGEGDENSAKDMGVMLEHCDRIKRATGACVMPIHHSKLDSERERGSSSFRAGLDTLLFVRNLDDERTLACEKQKDGRKFAPVRFELEATAVSCYARLTPSAEGAARPRTVTPRMLEALRILAGTFRGEEGALSTEWQRAARGIPEATFYSVRTRLIDDGYVKTQKAGAGYRNWTTEKGREALRAPLALTDSNENSNGSHEPAPGARGPAGSPPLSRERGESQSPGPAGGPGGRSLYSTPTRSNGNSNAHAAPATPLRLELPDALPDEPPPPDDDDAPWWTR